MLPELRPNRCLCPIPTLDDLVCKHRPFCHRARAGKGTGNHAVCIRGSLPVREDVQHTTGHLEARELSECGTCSWRVQFAHSRSADTGSHPGASILSFHSWTWRSASLRLSTGKQDSSEGWNRQSQANVSAPQVTGL